MNAAAARDEILAEIEEIRRSLAGLLAGVADGAREREDLGRRLAESEAETLRLRNENRTLRDNTEAWRLRIAGSLKNLG